MAAMPSVKVTKTMPFKGGTRRWSNRYHFDGGSPTTTGRWTTLSDAVVAAEKLCLKDTVTIVDVTGYDAGSDVPVFSKTYSVAGTDAAGGSYTPGECAALMRWSTTQRTSKNHPVYLFNYIHHIVVQTGSGVSDLLAAASRTLMTAYGNAWITGFSDGTATHHRAGPNGAVAQGVFVEEYVTHRDFPYTRSA